MNITVTLYKCSGCSLVALYPSKIKTHCKSTARCEDHHPIMSTFQLDFEDSANQTATPRERQKTGPKPLDIGEILRGRITSFSPEITDTFEYTVDPPDTRRIRYLFDTPGLLDTCMRSTVADVVPGQLVHFFRYLWGDKAPKEFQSIVMYRGRVYEIDDDEYIDHDEVGYTEYDSISDYFKTSNFLVDFLTIIRTLCILWIPEYREDLVGKARHILEWISPNDNQMTIYNVFEKDEKYAKDRKKFTRIVNRANSIKEVLKNIFPSTTIKKPTM